MMVLLGVFCRKFSENYCFRGKEKCCIIENEFGRSLIWERMDMAFRRKKKKIAKKGRSHLSYSSCLALDCEDLTNNPKRRPRQIFLFRTLQKWTIPQIAKFLKIREEKVLAEYLKYCERLGDFHDPRKVETEIEFCESEIRELIHQRGRLKEINESEISYMTVQIVSISKAIKDWEELICKLRGYLLPSSVMQQIMAERQRQLSTIDELTAEAQEEIFKILQTKKTADFKNSSRFGKWPAN